MLEALTDKLWFPSVYREDGLVAVGGDLRPERLLYAYARGIFPWYDAHSPILWWSPDPRCVLPFNKFHIPSRLKRKIKNGPFSCTLNKAFGLVINECATVSRNGLGGTGNTWLLPEMQAAYKKLHELGFALSAECWREGQLVGGIYGVAIGKAFFGESMFHHVSDASKIALNFLVENLIEQGFELFDCQQDTPHMLNMGACYITRSSFNYLLNKALLAGGVDADHVL